MIDFRIPRWIIPAGAVAISLGMIADAFLYYPALLRTGTLDPMADSIGIPIYSQICAALIFLPILLLYAAPAWRGYDGSARLLRNLGLRPARSAVALIAYGSPAALVAGERIHSSISGRPFIENYDWLFVLPLLLWLLVLRAAMAAPRPPEASSARRYSSTSI